MTSLVKAYNEIISVKIGKSIVSMSIAQKENESGLKFNERLFILVHNQFFGYISKVKINEEAETIDINSAKVKIPIKNFYLSQTQDCILKIQFSINVQGKIEPKEWIFQMTTVKLAQLWKQLLDYQVKMWKKNKKSSRREQKTIQIQKPQKTQNSVMRENPKIQTDRSMIQSKIQITTPQAAGKFDEGLFSDSDDEKKKSKSKVKQEKKPSPRKPIDIKKPDQQPQEVVKDLKVPKPALAPIQIQEQKKDLEIREVQQAQTQIKFKEEKPQYRVDQSLLSLPLIQEQLQSIPSNDSKRQNSVPNNNDSKTRKSIPSYQSKIRKSELNKPDPSKPNTSNRQRQESVISDSGLSKQNQQYIRKTNQNMNKPSNLSKQKQKNVQKKLTNDQKEVSFVHQILTRLDQKNNKFPINQITYNREEMSQLVNIYKDKLSKTINNKDTENRLNSIMNIQRQKMSQASSLRKSKYFNSLAKSWIYKQITSQWTKCLLQFKTYCSSIMKLLICEIYKNNYQQFKQKKAQNNIVQLEYEDLLIKVALIDRNQTKEKVSAQKSLKYEFKAFQYLYKIIENRGTIRVPLTSICQYAGITALFRAKPVYYEKDKYEDTLNRQLDRLQSISCLPLKRTLKNKVKPLNQFHYSQMRQGQTDSNFKFHFVDEVDHIFIFDLNNDNDSPQKVVRMQMIQQEINGKVLPFVPFNQTKNKANFTKDVHLLSHKILQKIEIVIKLLNNLDFYFVNPKQLSNYMHSNAINMRYLGKIYIQCLNQFSRSCLFSQLMARTCKKILNKTLQDTFFQQKQALGTAQNLQHQLNAKVIDFLNCLFGNNHETAALWQIIKSTAIQYYNVQIQGIQDLSKGQLLVSLAHHLNLTLKWKNNNASQIFQKSQFFDPQQNFEIKVKAKTFKPCLISTNLHEVSQKLLTQRQQNFKWLVESLNLKQQPISNHIKQQGLDEKLRLYLCNFIEPQQSDWSNSYSHLSLYQTDEPSLTNFRIDLLGIKWFLIKGNKFKYLNKFNEFSIKIQRLYGNTHPILSQLYELFSKHHKSKFQIQDSINFAKSSILNISGLGGDNNQVMAEKYYNLAQLLIRSKKDSQALEYLKKAKKIIEVSSKKKIPLYSKIKLQLGTIYFNQHKFQSVVSQLENVNQLLQIYQREDNSYEQQRIKVSYLLYNSYSCLKKVSQASQLCSYLQLRLKQFKKNIHYQQILWIIIQNSIKTVQSDSREALFKIFDMINIKHQVKFYKKAYDMLRKRDEEKNLFKLFKSYAANSPRIFQLIKQNRILQDWQNLAKLYERQSLFDFVSILQELLYFLGRDRLNTLASS